MKLSAISVVVRDLALRYFMVHWYVSLCFTSGWAGWHVNLVVMGLYLHFMRLQQINSEGASELRGPWICLFSESLASESLLSESLFSESLTSESLALESLSRGESQCVFSLPSESLPSESLFSEFPPSEFLLSEFPPSNLCRIQAPLNQTLLRLPPINGMHVWYSCLWCAACFVDGHVTQGVGPKL